MMLYEGNTDVQRNKTVSTSMINVFISFMMKSKRALYS